MWTVRPARSDAESKKVIEGPGAAAIKHKEQTAEAPQRIVLDAVLIGEKTVFYVVGGRKKQKAGGGLRHGRVSRPSASIVPPTRLFMVESQAQKSPGRQPNLFI